MAHGGNVAMWEGLSNAVTASILTRLLANIFAFLVLCAALLVATWELISSQPINPFVATILGTGIGYVLHLLGLNQGVTLEPSRIKPPTQPPVEKA